MTAITCRHRQVVDDTHFKCKSCQANSIKLALHMLATEMDVGHSVENVGSG